MKKSNNNNKVNKVKNLENFRGTLRTFQRYMRSRKVILLAVFEIKIFSRCKCQLWACAISRKRATTRATGVDSERNVSSYEPRIFQIFSRASSRFEHTHKAALKAVSKPFSQ